MERKKWKQEQRIQLANDCNWTCHICGNVIIDKYDLTLDHVIPLAKGGEDELHNIKPAHRKCNEFKADRDLVTKEEIKELYPEIPIAIPASNSLGDYLSNILTTL